MTKHVGVFVCIMYIVSRNCIHCGVGCDLISVHSASFPQVIQSNLHIQFWWCSLYFQTLHLLSFFQHYHGL